MLFKVLLIKISYVFLAMAIVLFVAKIVLYNRYRASNKENISLNLAWYRQMKIYATSSSSKRKFMQQMNFITSIIFVSMMVFIVVFALRKFT